MKTSFRKTFVFCSLVSSAYLYAASSFSTTTTYIYSDPLGTVVAEADENGNLMAQFDERPYGSPYGGSGMSAAKDGPGYTAHVEDVDTALLYMQARYYDPAVGRFLSVDPAGIGVAEIFTFSSYAYADNNPIINMDPDGRCTGSNVQDKAGNCADSGATVASSSGGTGGVHAVAINPAISRYFTHQSVDKDHNATPSAFPQATKEALSELMDSPQGKSLTNAIAQIGQKLDLYLVADESEAFKWSEQFQGVSYTLNVDHYIATHNANGELTGLTLDVILMHEFGHSPQGERAFGNKRTGDYWQNEFSTVRSVENPYRAWKGMSPRKSYGGHPIP